MKNGLTQAKRPDYGIGVSTSPRKPDYGVDVPTIVLVLIIGSLVSITLGIIAYLDLEPNMAGDLYHLGISAGILLMIPSALAYWNSKIGLIFERNRLIKSISWRGDETVLDVGCGRGLMLIGAAKHLTTGKAVGIDAWSSDLKSDNRPEKTLQNARLEGVAERVEVKEGHPHQKFPFDDNSFDMVISSYMLYHISNQKGRENAVREMVRVLKPAGQLIILDVFVAKECLPILQDLGMEKVKKVSQLPYVFPIAQTIKALKPSP